MTSLRRAFGWLSWPTSVLVGAAALAGLLWISGTAPPPLQALHNISVPIDAQIARSVLAPPRPSGELRVAFISNCFFHGAIMNGPRHTVLPDSLSLVGRFRRQAGPEVITYNASVDGTSILDHLALLSILREYEVDVVVIAMSYTEFRRLPLHRLLGNLRDRLLELGVAEEDLAASGSSRGRVLSMDFQRWLTARKYDIYNAIPTIVTMQLWNLKLREHARPRRSETYFREVYGGTTIPVQHLGLASPVDQDLRQYMDLFIDVAVGSGIRVVLVNQPIRFQDVIDAANPGIFAEHRALLADAAAQHDDVEFFDLDDQVDGDRYLSDYIHMTYDGVEGVSALLVPELLRSLSLPGAAAQ